MTAEEAENQRIRRLVAAGKMFRRMTCDRCGGRFHFTESPRVSRVPVCPGCGSYAAREQAA
jgi:hypothetical protein